MPITPLANGDTGLAARTKINSAIAQLNNRKALNIRDYGAVGDGVTDDSAAIKAAIDASNAFKFASTPGITPVVYAPSGIYLLKNTTLPIFWGGGGIVGDGQDKTMFQLDPAYNGDVFSWSEAWYGGPFFSDATNGSTKPTGSAEEVTLGPFARDFSIFGDQSSANTVVALGLYDRCDNVMFSDISVHWCKRGLYIGGPKIQVQSYNRESHYRNLKFWECGTATLPAVELTSTGSGDSTNQVCFYDLNIFAPKSVGLWLRGNVPTTAARLIRFYGLRIEQSVGRDTGDLMMIGDPTMTGYVRDVYIYGLIMIQGGASYACLRLTADTGAHMPYLIGVHGGDIGGNGKGIAIDYGRSLAFEVNTIGTPGTAGKENIVVGANISAPIYLNGFGNEATWTKSVAGASQQACLRYPNHASNEITLASTPGTIANNAFFTQNINVPGARYGDFVAVSYDQSLQGVQLIAQATPDVVACRFQNNTGASVTLTAGNLRARVVRQNI